MTNNLNEVAAQFLESQRKIQESLQPSLEILQAIHSTPGMIKVKENMSKIQSQLSNVKNILEPINASLKSLQGAIPNIDNLNQITHSYSQHLKELSTIPKVNNTINSLSYSLNINDVSDYIDNRYKHDNDTLKFEADLVNVTNELQDISFDENTEIYFPNSEKQESKNVAEFLNKIKTIALDDDFQQVIINFFQSVASLLPPPFSLLTYLTIFIISIVKFIYKKTD